MAHPGLGGHWPMGCMSQEPSLPMARAQWLPTSQKELLTFSIFLIGAKRANLLSPE